MGKINILDKHVAELIAAGEVVERPSSVIKELVENSIDAGADAITVEIKNGGVTFMRVTDNGSGILREDIRPAFVRHATSKVCIEDDLDAIATLGFRGEALASVSSVSHLELITKAREEGIGTRYLIEGGEEISLDDAGCPDGTTFIIRDLFYNVPARMKFLKTDMAEGNAVSNVVDKIALSHPEIAITYIRDQKTCLRTTGDGKLLSAIYAVYGRDFASTLIPVDYTLGGVSVKGYISRPENARPNRNMQNFFINKRFVISKTAMAALSEACKGSVMTGKFPSCVLNIELSFNAVDVNVHPTKLEVRFVNERPVFDAVYHAVKTALLNGDKRVEVTRTVPKNRVNPFELAKKVFREEAPSSPRTDTSKLGEKADEPKASDKDALIEMLDESPDIETKDIKKDTAKDTAVPEPSTKPKRESPNELISLSDESPDKSAAIPKTVSVESPDYPVIDRYRRIIEEKRRKLYENVPTIDEIKSRSAFGDDEDEADDEDAEPKTLIDTDDNGYKYVGEAFMTYIILEKNPRELVLIDKHAAHERIIYEKLKRDKGVAHAQMLLDPIVLTVNKIDYVTIAMHFEMFDEAGFDIDIFGPSSLIVRSAPSYLDYEDIEPAVLEMAGYLDDNDTLATAEKIDWIYHNVACRAAVKGGNRSTKRELIALVEQIEAEDVRHCPHGRPVAVTLKKTELERWFGRT